MADGGRLDTRAAESRGEKRGGNDDEKEEEEEEGPREPAVKLAAVAAAGRNTATRSVLNRTQPSREAAIGRRGERRVERRGPGSCVEQPHEGDQDFFFFFIEDDV